MGSHIFGILGLTKHKLVGIQKRTDFYYIKFFFFMFFFYFYIYLFIFIEDIYYYNYKELLKRK